MSLGPYWKDPAAKLPVQFDWSLDFPGGNVTAVVWISSDSSLVVTGGGSPSLTPTADLTGGLATPSSFDLGEDPALPVVPVREYTVACQITLDDGHVDRRSLTVWVASL